MYYHVAIGQESLSYAVNGISTQERENAAHDWISAQVATSAVYSDEPHDDMYFRLVLCIMRAHNHVEHDTYNCTQWQKALARLNTLSRAVETFR